MKNRCLSKAKTIMKKHDELCCKEKLYYSILVMC